jgi:hypothetical protein
VKIKANLFLEKNRSEYVASGILNMDTEWMSVASFTLLLLYLRRMSAGQPQDRPPDVPQCLSGQCGDEQIAVLLLESNPHISDV